MKSPLGECICFGEFNWFIHDLTDKPMFFDQGLIDRIIECQNHCPIQSRLQWFVSQHSSTSLFFSVAEPVISPCIVIVKNRFLVCFGLLGLKGCFSE